MWECTQPPALAGRGAEILDGKCGDDPRDLRGVIWVADFSSVLSFYKVGNCEEQNCCRRRAGVGSLYSIRAGLDQSKQYIFLQDWRGEKHCIVLK